MSSRRMREWVAAYVGELELLGRVELATDSGRRVETARLEEMAERGRPRPVVLLVLDHRVAGQQAELVVGSKLQGQIHAPR